MTRKTASQDNPQGAAEGLGEAVVDSAQKIWLAGLGASSKLNAEWDFIAMLRDEGRKSADAFLRQHASDLGTRSTTDIDVLLEES